MTEDVRDARPQLPRFWTGRTELGHDQTDSDAAVTKVADAFFLVEFGARMRRRCSRLCEDHGPNRTNSRIFLKWDDVPEECTSSSFFDSSLQLRCGFGGPLTFRAQKM